MVLIDKAALLNKIAKEVHYDSEHSLEMYAKMLSLINDAPTVDAEPVKHGHWIFNPKDAIEMMFTLPKCSECGAESSDGGNYCPNCGAKMDEVEDG